LRGDVAEWLRSGLQSRLHRFDSGRRLIGDRRERLVAAAIEADATRPQLDAQPCALEKAMRDHTMVALGTGNVISDSDLDALLMDG
jgi:hypothetical protein